MLALLDNEPATPAAFEAAQWLLLNSPDGADVQKAADVILQAHIQRADLVYNINSWPTIYVLDRKGVIRYRGLYHRSEIATAVNTLHQE